MQVNLHLLADKLLENEIIDVHEQGEDTDEHSRCTADQKIKLMLPLK